MQIISVWKIQIRLAAGRDPAVACSDFTTESWQHANNCAFRDFAASTWLPRMACGSCTAYMLAENRWPGQPGRQRGSRLSTNQQNTSAALRCKLAYRKEHDGIRKSSMAAQAQWCGPALDLGACKCRRQRFCTWLSVWGKLLTVTREC